MSASRTAVVAGVVIAALAGISLFFGESKARRLRGEIEALGERHARAEATVEGRRAEAERAAAAASPAALETALTVRDLVAHAEADVDLETLMNSMMQAMMTQDFVTMIKIFMPLAQLTPERYDALLDEVDAYSGTPQQKQMVTQMLGMFAPTDDPKAALERLVELELEPHAYSDMLGRWAKKEPAQALAWFKEKLAAGELDGKGINDRPERYMLGDLVAGLAEKDASLAVDTYIEYADESYSWIAGRLARSLGKHVAEGGGDADLQRLLASPQGATNPENLVASALATAAAGEPFGEAARFAERYLTEEGQRFDALTEWTKQEESRAVDKRVDELLAYLPEDRAPEAAAEVLSHEFRRGGREEVDAWIAEQPPGGTRDVVIESIASHLRTEGEFEESLRRTAEISDPEAREALQLQATVDWLAADQEAARAALPPEQIEAALKRSAELSAERGQIQLESRFIEVQQE